jgi:hypothetical protein
MAAPSRSTRAKVLSTALAVAGVTAVAGLGTFGSFTSTTSASETVSTGTVQIALGTAGTAANRLTVAASGLVPGDTVQRAADVAVTGDQDLSAVTLTTTATTSSVLDTDTTNGLQMTVDSCPGGWTESGAAPAYTYSCGTTPVTLVASRPVVGSNLPLTGLDVTAGSVNHLRVTLTLPTSADNTFQNTSSVVDFAFTGVQRAGTNR